MKSELGLTTKRLNLNSLNKDNRWLKKNRSHSLISSQTLLYALKANFKQRGTESHPVVWVGGFYLSLLITLLCTEHLLEMDKKCKPVTAV